MRRTRWLRGKHRVFRGQNKFSYSKGIDHEQEHEHDYETELLPQHREHTDAAIAVAPFVVVPADDLHESSAVSHRQFAVEDARVRVTDDIDRDQGFVGVFEYTFVTLARGGFLERVVDRFHGRVLLNDRGEIGHR